MYCSNTAALNEHEQRQAHNESLNPLIEARALDIASLNTDDDDFITRITEELTPEIFGGFVADVLLVGDKATASTALIELITSAAKEYFDDQASREVFSEERGY